MNHAALLALRTIQARQHPFLKNVLYFSHGYFQDRVALIDMMPLSYLVDIIFDENATAKDLLILVGALAVFWALAFYVIADLIIRPLVYGKPWLIAAGERDYDRGGKELHEKLGMPKTKDQFVVQFMDQWSWLQVVGVQHLLGGLLCLPAILGLGDPSVASSLACLGVLSEMGWEIEDMLTLIYKRYFLPDGKDKVPGALLVLLGVHHSMTTILGLPLVLHYRNFEVLHWLCFDLQAAAACALMISEYTKLLDVTKPSQLIQFQVLTGFALMVMVGTRGFHWIYLCARFMYVWYEDKAWVFLGVGTCMSLLFSAFNWVGVIEPFYKRFVKFMKISAEFKALPDTSDAKTRRISIINLEAAASDVLSNQRLEEELINSLFAKRNVDRRQTLPPSSFRGKRTMRSSVVLLRSSISTNRDIYRLLSQLDVRGE